MTKNPERTEQTRKNLMDAFWYWYCRKRIDTISVKEITGKAGYNRGTFYEYFRDVYDVLEQLEIMVLPTLADMPAHAQSPGSKDFIHAFMHMYQSRFEYYQVLLGDNGDPSFQRKLKNSIKTILSGLLPASSADERVEIDYIFEYVLSGMIGLMMYGFRNNPGGSYDELIVRVRGYMQGDMIARLRTLAEQAFPA